jgi:molybdenum-dependent DNA-binding transcriptional regulator ModE
LCTTDDADVPRLLVDPGLIIGSRMDRLANIAAFVSVVENGGFTAAARHLNVSPTMVSNHVQELEDRLGARLLNRTTRKVSLTEIGREYYERSAHILADLDEADRTAGALTATPRGRLRVYCHPRPVHCAGRGRLSAGLSRGLGRPAEGRSDDRSPGGRV